MFFRGKLSRWWFINGNDSTISQGWLGVASLRMINILLKQGVLWAPISTHNIINNLSCRLNIPLQGLPGIPQLLSIKNHSLKFKTTYPPLIKESLQPNYFLPPKKKTSHNKFYNTLLAINKICSRCFPRKNKHKRSFSKKSCFFNSKKCKLLHKLKRSSFKWKNISKKCKKS